MTTSRCNVFNYLLIACFLPLIYFNLIFLGHSSDLSSKGASSWVKTNETAIRLISENLTIGPSHSVRLGLQFVLKKGWKIYWRSPGDSGLPPEIRWQHSMNLEDTRFYWPVPSRFSFSGIETLGYKKEVIFPIRARVKDNTKILKLRANVNYLACNDICIPYKTEVRLDIPPSSTTQYIPLYSKLINRYVAKVPSKGKPHQLKVTSANLAGSLLQSEKGVRKGFIDIEIESKVPFDNPDIYLEGPESIFFGLPEITLNPKKKTVAKFRVPVTEEGDSELSKYQLSATFRDGDRSFERSLLIKKDKLIQVIDKSILSFPIIIAFAFLGGLILNLMPCVLPVISIKILSILSPGNSNLKTVRKNFVASALGIICCFLIIGAALTSLKLAGKTIGWGIQFQHPWFIVGLSIVIVLFAYNLWGIFEIKPPHWLNKAAGSYAIEEINHNSFTYNFLTGIFATVLATPCSAPFLGTAIGFALAGSNFDIMLIFLLLGLGMAMPYLLIATFPRFGNILPKPGVWMLTVRRVLGFALIGTSLWLLSIIALQISTEVALFIGALIFVIGLILITNNLLNKNYGKITWASIIATIIVAVFLPYLVTTQDTKSELVTESHWQEFKPNDIPYLIGKGKTVFVDITAEWCITCKVNKAAVLNRDEIRALLAQKKVVSMQGDWTKPNDKILNYIKKFGRFGIPFNAVYGPNMVSGKILPELLTTGIVINSLREAAKE